MNYKNEQLTPHSRANYIDDIKLLLSSARQEAYTAVNSAMVRAYWLIGERIVLEEQNGKERADYGKSIIKNLSLALSSDFGKSYDEREIRKIRQFYLTFPIRDSVSTKLESTDRQECEKRDSLSPTSVHSAEKEQGTIGAKLEYYLFNRLSWTHIRHLIRVSDDKARAYYIKEAVENNWSTSTLARNIVTQYYEQIFASKYKLFLPTEEELRAEIEREKMNLKLQMEKGGKDESK